jgi:hypothetical protein
MNRQSVRSLSDLSRRAALGRVAAVGAAVAVGSRVSRVAAQDVTATHPLVGAWHVAAPDNPSRPVALNNFGADGTAHFTVDDGTEFHGAWEATGPRTAALTAVAFNRDPGGALVGLWTLRASVEVDEAGQSFSSEGDEKVTAFDGTVLGPAPNAVVGTRITVQPIGTPAAGTPVS